MGPPETERRFLSKTSEYLLSLPSDLKVLQEAASDPDLDRGARELAAGTIVHTLLPQEGDGVFRFVDDVFLVRATLAAVRTHGGDGAVTFVERFPGIYLDLDQDLDLFSSYVGADLWRWLTDQIPDFPRLPYKGKRATQYLVTDEELARLYEEGLEFETNYNLTAGQIQNRFRRGEQVVEFLARRRSEPSRKIPTL